MVFPLDLNNVGIILQFSLPIFRGKCKQWLNKMFANRNACLGIFYIFNSNFFELYQKKISIKLEHKA